MSQPMLKENMSLLAVDINTLDLIFYLDKVINIIS